MRKSPEIKLWLHVMRQGLADLVEALSREARGLPAGEADLEELRVWVFEADGPGSFEWLCDAVEVDAARARDIIRVYWSRQSGAERVRPEFRRVAVSNGRMRVRMAATRLRPPRPRKANTAGERVSDEALVMS